MTHVDAIPPARTIIVLVPAVRFQIPVTGDFVQQWFGRHRHALIAMVPEVRVE